MWTCMFCVCLFFSLLLIVAPRSVECTIHCGEWMTKPLGKKTNACSAHLHTHTMVEEKRGKFLITYWMSVYEAWFNRFKTHRHILSERVTDTVTVRLLFAQLFLVDNLIKLFIVDIYHVIKHATFCIYNNKYPCVLHRSGIAFDIVLSFSIFISSLHVSS